MDLGPVDHITADAVGEPGDRTFYIQARAGKELVTVDRGEAAGAAARRLRDGAARGRTGDRAGGR